MATTKQKLQYEILYIDTDKNPLLQSSSLPSLDHGLKTKNKKIIKAINEVFQMAKNMIKDLNEFKVRLISLEDKIKNNSAGGGAKKMLKAYDLGTQDLSRDGWKFKFPEGMKFNYMPRIQVFEGTNESYQDLLLDTAVTVYNRTSQYCSCSIRLLPDCEGVSVNANGYNGNLRLVLLLEE